MWRALKICHFMKKMHFEWLNAMLWIRQSWYILNHISQWNLSCIFLENTHPIECKCLATCTDKMLYKYGFFCFMHKWCLYGRMYFFPILVKACWFFMFFFVYLTMWCSKYLKTPFLWWEIIETTAMIHMCGNASVPFKFLCIFLMLPPMSLQSLNLIDRHHCTTFAGALFQQRTYWGDQFFGTGLLVE